MPWPTDLTFVRTAALFSAFANEGRLRVLVALRQQGPLSVSTLVPLSGLEQTALSHQLRALRTAQLVSSERRGKQIVYALADEHVGCILDDAIAHIDHAHHVARGAS
jgi:DNA-binding transcriptional ArsR family regulator